MTSVFRSVFSYFNLIIATNPEWEMYSYRDPEQLISFSANLQFTTAVYSVSFE